MNTLASTDVNQKAKNLTTIIYALYGASLIFGITALVAIVLNYMKRGEMAGTFLESHFRWQMRTFWFGLVWLSIGAVSLVFVIGWFILVSGAIWFIYRVAKGWIRLNDNLPMDMN